MTFAEDNAKAWSEIRQLTKLADPIPETVNGPGATLAATEQLRAQLPDLLRRYNIKTVLDVGCGDWTWMQHVDLSMLDFYTGWDVDETAIKENQAKFYLDNPRVTFEHRNILTETDIPKVDLIIARQLLMHFPNNCIRDVLAQFKDSGSTYLLSSTWPGDENSDNQPDGYAHRGYMERTVNLEADPFNLPEILDSIEEPSQIGGVLHHHYLGLFKLPARSFHTRVHPATENPDNISFMGALAAFKKRVDKATVTPERVQKQMVQLTQDAEDRADRLRKIRDHLREIHQIASNDTPDSISTVLLLLGAHSTAIDAILQTLIGDTQ